MATKTKTKQQQNANGHGPGKSKLQSFIEAIPQDPDVNWLFDRDTINEGANLTEANLMIVCHKLKETFAAGDVASWRSQVRKVKSQQPSHIQIANMYIRGNKDRIMFTRGDWHVYDHGVWSTYPEFLFMQEIKALLENLEKAYGMQFSSHHANSVVSYIQTDLSVEEKLVDADPNLINMRNGIFCIDSRELLPHSPNYKLTSQLPFDYDPDARCPMWQQYLESTFIESGDDPITDVALIAFLRQSMGYSLTVDTSRDKTFWCIGEGSNGKGVLFHILRMLVGDASIALDINNLSNNQYQLAMLAGKKIAFCTEADKDANMVNDGQIKALISGEEMMVRQIRERPFVLRNTAKLWWSMNNFPHVRDTSHGFWRRVLVIPFNRIFRDGDVILDLKHRLENELSGIFNWAIEGLTSLEKQGWIMPKQVAELTEQYQKEANVVQLFIEEKYMKGDKTVDKVGAGDLYDEYRAWCQNNGYQAKSNKNFKNETIRLGYKWDKDREGRWYYGLKLAKEKTTPISM